MTTTARILLALLIAASTAMPPSPLLAFPGWKYEGCLSSRAAPQRLLAGFVPSPDPNALHTIDGCLDSCASDLKFAALAIGSCYCAVNLPDIAPYKTELDTFCDYPCDGWLHLSCGGMMDPQMRGPKAISLYSRRQDSLLQAVMNRTTAAKDHGGLVSATSPSPNLTRQLVAQKEGLDGVVRFQINGGAVNRDLPRKLIGAVVGLMAVMLAFLIVS